MGLMTNELAQGEIRLDLGGEVVSLVSTTDSVNLCVDEPFAPFLSCSAPDVRLELHCGSALQYDPGELLFDSGGMWRLERAQGKLILSQHNPFYGLIQLTILDPDLRAGDVYCVEEHWRDADYPVSSFIHPLAQVLLIALLARGCGVLLHACGVSDGGRGYVFAGPSGAGKSTLAELWQEQHGVRVLNDDRIVVREREGRFWVHGTPWHGSVPLASPEAAPLERVFVIHHDAENRARPLSPLGATAGLLAQSFPPFWDAEGMAFTLEFLDRLSQAVPCHELGFVPRASAIDLVRSL
jgi:hypothetical protein